MFFSVSCQKRAIALVWWTDKALCPQIRCDLFCLDFFATALFEVAISFFVAKLVCRRARPGGLDQWRIAQIFLYRACGLGLRLQNKEYLCAILGAALYCTYFLCTVKLIY